MEINATTPGMPFDLILDDEENEIQINDDIKDSLNSKTGVYKGRDDLSMLDIYRLSNLTDREIWELSKIHTEFNRQNMSFEHMYPSFQIIQDVLLDYYNHEISAIRCNG